MIHSVSREWDNEECFIVCGGESVAAHDLSRLAGRKVIVINSSFYQLPNADYLVFSDKRWWDEHHAAVRARFKGRVVTITNMRPSPDYLLMERQRSSGLSPRPDHLALWHTTTCAATNLAAHLGSRAINYMGLDGQGGWHHVPHKWKQSKNKFHYHDMAIAALVEPLRALSIAAYNANPKSAYSYFPHKSFEEMVA